MEAVLVTVVVVLALTYAARALRREVRPGKGGGCTCDCPQAGKCTGTTCSVLEDALPRPSAPKRPPAA